MPRGPKGEKRPADVIGNAVHVMRVATGEIEDVSSDPAVDPSEAGRKGGKSRAESCQPRGALKLQRRLPLHVGAAKGNRQHSFD